MRFEQGAVVDVNLTSGKVRAVAQVDAVPPLAVSGMFTHLSQIVQKIFLRQICISLFIVYVYEC